jgi:hypothetical protein
MVSEYKKMGGKYKGAKKAATGGIIEKGNDGFIARGCGAVMEPRRKVTKMRGR